jgi:hypothetical protein
MDMPELGQDAVDVAPVDSFTRIDQMLSGTGPS